MDIQVEYAKKLYLLRRTSERKQQDLAENLGISQQAYSKLEKGELTFSDEILDKVCTVFDVSLEDFVKSDLKMTFVNSPYAANNNTNINSAITEQLLNSLLDEVKQSRDERSRFLGALEKLLK